MAKKEFPLKAFVNVLLVVAIVAVLATEITGAATEKLCRTNTELLEYSYVNGVRTGKIITCNPGYTCEDAACVAKPDLLVESLAVTKSGSNATIAVNVKNQGAADSKSTNLYVEVNEGTEKAGVMKYTVKVNPISAGQSLPIKVEHALKHPGNDIKYALAEIDSLTINSNFNSEADEFNNKKEYP